MAKKKDYSHGLTRKNTDEERNKKSAFICENQWRKKEKDIVMLKYEEMTDKIIKAFYETYNELGTGFIESVYENALYNVLVNYGLRVEKQKEIQVYFRGDIVGNFRTDLIVENKIILELKAVNKIIPIYEAQLINYLKATEIEVGFIMNFGHKPEFIRRVFNNE